MTIYDLLFARAGRPHCPKCGQEAVSRQSPQQIVDQILTMPATTKFQVLAPVIRERKGEFVDLFAETSYPRLFTCSRRWRNDLAL